MLLRQKTLKERAEISRRLMLYVTAKTQTQVEKHP